MREAAIALLTILTLAGCEGKSPSDPTVTDTHASTNSTPADPRKSSGAVPMDRVFGIARDFSGKLNEKEEASVPEPLRGAFYIESAREITKTNLEKELKFKTIVAEENHDGKRYVALKDFRHVQFSDEVSGQMIVIERYLVVPN